MRRTRCRLGRAALSGRESALTTAVRLARTSMVLLNRRMGRMVDGLVPSGRGSATERRMVEARPWYCTGPARTCSHQKTLNRISFHFSTSAIAPGAIHVHVHVHGNMTCTCTCVDEPRRNCRGTGRSSGSAFDLRELSSPSSGFSVFAELLATTALRHALATAGGRTWLAHRVASIARGVTLKPY